MARLSVASKAPETGNLSLKDFLNAQQNTSLAFTGEATDRGNPLFTNGVATHPVAMALLMYYIREGVVEIDGDDNIVCSKGWRIKDDTWQPKARVNYEL